VITIVQLFYYLTILNIFDAIVTWFGLEHAIISELNPLMGAIYEVNPVFFVIYKVTLSIFLLIFIFLKKVPRSPLIKGVTLLASLSYTAVVLVHGFWLIQLI
jgi:hypothetical protein